jgi:tRNA A-37 threonylcarbamoyl transferase component Bud32
MIDRVEHLHKIGFIHNRIEPSNIVIENGLVTIIDFSNSTKINDYNKTSNHLLMLIVDRVFYER